MQIFWFSMIIKLLIKVLVLREDLSDIRDVEEEKGKTGGKGLKENGSLAHRNGPSTEYKKKQ